MVGSDKFGNWEVEFMKTGHTHNGQDQRFSTVATTLSRAPVLEDPEDFKGWIMEHVAPVRGRALHVEVLNSTMNFQKWLAPLNIKICGLTATCFQEDTNHCWRFIQRRNLSSLLNLDLEEVENTHPDWRDLPSHEADVILLVKESISSGTLSQKPLVILPHAILGNLFPADLEPVSRMQFGESGRELKEFRKTAAAVEGEPWNLFKAAQYLRTLCDDNEQNKPIEPLSLPILDYTAPKPEAIHCHSMLRSVAPRAIQVGTVPRKEMLKRMGLQLLKRPAAAKKRPAAHDPAAEPEEPAMEPGDEAGEEAAVEPIMPAPMDAANDDAAAAAEAVPQGRGLGRAREAGSARGGKGRARGVGGRGHGKGRARGGDEGNGEGRARGGRGRARGVGGRDHGEGRGRGRGRGRADEPVLPEPGLPRMQYGCSKCRKSRKGCKQCRAWAATGHKGYQSSATGDVWRNV